MAGKRKPQLEEYMEWLNAHRRKLSAEYRKQDMRDLYLGLLECYNTMPIYITDPAVFSRQCASAMSEAPGPEEFVDMVVDIKERNMADAVSLVQSELKRKGGRNPALTCLVSMDSMLDLAGLFHYEGFFKTDSPTLEELSPDWFSDVWAYLTERSECQGDLPLVYSSSEESGSEEDSQSDYSESSGDEEPVKPSEKSQKRGSTKSTTSSRSNSASSTEGRTLRNGKRTRSFDDADTVVDESPKKKRRRKGETASSNSSRKSNRSSRSSSRSGYSPETESAPQLEEGLSPLEEEDSRLLRRLGRLNRVAGRRSV